MPLLDQNSQTNTHSWNVVKVPWSRQTGEIYQNHFHEKTKKIRIRRPGTRFDFQKIRDGRGHALEKNYNCQTSFSNSQDFFVPPKARQHQDVFEATHRDPFDMWRDYLGLYSQIQGE
jgi:hypothetical protein